ncbi:hypothetical protein GGS20DRAFT_289487 [Poronia punctata]|nr:hypothetical protein GGS20DRAFT_289487 [Poronia punctata]
MLQASNRSYVCWQCATRHITRPSIKSTTSVARIVHNAVQPAGSSSIRGLATVEHGNLKYKNNLYPQGKPDNIRRRLQKWQEENPTPAQMIISDFSDQGHFNNNLSRPQSVSMIQVDTSNNTPLFFGDELMDLRSDDAMLSPGDLVELASADSRRPGLAICLGRVDGYEHFYTIGGKWFTASGVRSLFVVEKFVSPMDLKPIVDALPPITMPAQQLNTLQELGEGPSREAGAGLLRQMMEFAHKAEAIYLANAGILDASSSFIGHPLEHRYLTLHEIATHLLPKNERLGGKFTTHALYAVHRAIIQNDIFFRPLRHTGHRRSYLFEVSPLSEVVTIQKAEKMVREYVAKQSMPVSARPSGTLPLEKFVESAQSVIDFARNIRKQPRIDGLSSLLKTPGTEPQWSKTDRIILDFMALWAGYQKFSPSSPIQSYGSVILRALGRYDDTRGYVPSTGWTFLQEIGWIPRWEIPSRYTIRFPEVQIQRGGSYSRPLPARVESYLKEDALASLRQPLDGITAYCIDDISTRDRDDAVSLERTENPDEYWIHVHIADPASSLSPDTPIAKHAELIPQTIYLPGHGAPMLPDDLVLDRFSLGPDRPCLTFSALVNTSGIVLSEKIAPHTLKNVLYMTYKDVASAIGEIRPNPFGQKAAQWGVGNPPKAKDGDKIMTRAEDLTEAQRADLEVLSKLGKAVQARRLAKGAVPFFQPRAVAEVDVEPVETGDSEYFAPSAEDPSIHVRYSHPSESDLVENAMKLANEVAARWCYEKSIPIPYRTQPHAMRHPELVQQYALEVLNPALNSGKVPSDEVWRRMHSLLGTDEILTEPGPHFLLGSDMYTKATSPLRRYSDLIVHWQIEATLLEEQRLGRPLAQGKGKGRKIQSDDLSFLPFKRDHLDRMMPMLRFREKQARALSNIDGQDQWILQAMERAWRFKEAPLPETFKMTVVHRTASNIIGRLDWFDRQAILRYENLNEVALAANISAGDVIDVRLIDINVHGKEILVEALQMVQKAEDPAT